MMNVIPRRIAGRRAYIRAQRGVVLFFALVALVIIMLAAVALVRSVDTSTIIAGNLAFKQSANASADAGLARAITWLTAEQASNGQLDPYVTAAHTYNVSNPAVGYYSYVDDATLNLFDDATWVNGSSSPEITDASGNRVRYIVQRMCRTENQLLSESDCLFSDASNEIDSMKVKAATQIINNSSSSSPMVRITVRVDGARNTVSYIQAFVY